MANTNGAGRVPPHDLPAERALIGSMLITRDAVDAAIAAGVDAGSFYMPAHAHIFQAVLRLAAAGDPIDPTTVGSALGDLLDPIGGRQALLKLHAQTPASANARAYARTVADAARQRRYLALAADLTDTVYSGGDIARVIEQLEQPLAAASTWKPVDVPLILAGDLTPPQPTILERAEDHNALLYPGRVHTFQGESESLKSWIALLACAQQIEAGRPVLYLDFEDTAESILGRLLSMSVPKGELGGLFTYIRPGEGLDVGAAHQLERLITQRRYTLAVVDGVTEAMSLDGLDLLDNKDVATWLARLPRRIADLGPAVVMIDHVTKSKDSRDRYAIGAQHKLAGIDGAAFSIDPIHPLAHLAENAVEPVTGVSRITITKDRPGAVRGFAAGNRHVGELHITAYPDRGITARIVPAVELPEGGFRPTHLMEKISQILTGVPEPGLSKRAIRGGVKGKSEAKDLALELLVAEGYVAATPGGPRGAIFHRTIRPFVAKDDDAPDQQQSLDEEEPF